MSARTRRGQPLIALGMVLSCWVMCRAAMWDWPIVAPSQAQAPGAAIAASKAQDRAPAASRDEPPSAAQPWRAKVGAPLGEAYEPVEPALPRPVPLLPELAPPAPLPTPSASTRADAPRIAAGHQLLWLAGVSQLALPPDVARHFAARTPQQPPSASAPASSHSERRWSADGWLLLRRGGNGFNLPGSGLPGANLPSGSYGASQAGAVVRFHLAPASPHQPRLYLRASSGLERPRGEEAALGLSLRPLPKIPVAAMAEARVTRTPSGNIVRPAAALVSEFPPQPLPLGLRAEAYVQAGWVGGKGSTAFADGQARIERPLLEAGRFELRAGAGAWGGAQRGAQRVDVGPTATLSVPLGGANGRVSADWRFRVAGHAAPNSGPAVTLSAGF